MQKVWAKIKALFEAFIARVTGFVAKDGKAIGIIAVADIIKETSTKAIRRLKEMGIKVYMLTGDNKNTAEAIAVHICLTFQ